MAQAQEVYLFRPTQISGCILWLDAADSTVFTGSAWTDKSGTGNNAVNPSPGTTNIPSVTSWTNNRRAARFSSANNNSIRTTNSIPQFNVTYFYVLRVRALNNDNMLFINSSAGQRQMRITTNTFPCDIRFSANTINGFLVPITVSQNQPFLLCATINATTLTLVPNGSVFGTTQNASSSADSINYFGAATDNTLYANCDYAEIIIYNSSLSTTDRQQVEGYLAWKWNLQGSLPSNHPFKTYPPYTQSSFPLIGIPTPPLQAQNSPAFFPTQIPNCILWLDGADRATISLSGNNITGWTDKSGLGNSVNSISSPAPTYSAATTGVRFTAASQTFLRGSLDQLYTSGSASVFVVSSPLASASANANPRFVVLGSNTTNESVLIGQFNIVFNLNSTPPYYATYLGTSTDPTGVGTNIQTILTGAFSTRSIFTNISTYNGSAFTTNTFLNGNTQSVNSARSGTFTAGSFYVQNVNKYGIGAYINGSPNAGDCFNGDINEVIIYPRQLTTAQQQQIEGYLAWKWGLQASLPANHPFATVPFNPFPYPLVPTVAVRNSVVYWQPTQISGCALWFDAADPSTLTPANPRGGTSITGWRDKVNNITLTNQNTAPTYQSNGILFTNPSSLISGSTQNLIYVGSTPISLTQNYTMFVVHAPNLFDNYRVAFTAAAPSAYNLNPTFAAWVQPSTSEGNTIGVWDGSSSYRQQQVWALVNTGAGNTRIDTLLASSANIARTNGVSNPTLTTNIGAGSNIPGSQTLTGIGMSASSTFQGNRAYDGRICEVILYTSTLPLTSVLQVEAYLAWKWSAQGILPTNNPFRLFPPSP